MDEDKLKAIVKEVVNEAVEPLAKRLEGIEGQLGNPDIGLAAINRRLDANTAAVVELESTVNGYADMYKTNDSNIRRMEKRSETLEENAGLDVPPDLKLEPLSETLSP